MFSEFKCWNWRLLLLLFILVRRSSNGGTTTTSGWFSLEHCTWFIKSTYSTRNESWLNLAWLINLLSHVVKVNLFAKFAVNVDNNKYCIHSNDTKIVRSHHLKNSSFDLIWWIVVASDPDAVVLHLKRHLNNDSELCASKCTHNSPQKRVHFSSRLPTTRLSSTCNLSKQSNNAIKPRASNHVWCFCCCCSCCCWLVVDEDITTGGGCGDDDDDVSAKVNV